VERDGVRVFWERYGDGDPTLLLVPPWSIYHSRVWKAQIPYFARRHRVLTFDPRGNGRSGHCARELPMNELPDPRQDDATEEGEYRTIDSHLASPIMLGVRRDESLARPGDVLSGNLTGVRGPGWADRCMAQALSLRRPITSSASFS